MYGLFSQSVPKREWEFMVCLLHLLVGTKAKTWISHFENDKVSAPSKTNSHHIQKKKKKETLKWLSLCLTFISHIRVCQCVAMSLQCFGQYSCRWSWKCAKRWCSSKEGVLNDWRIPALLLECLLSMNGHKQESPFCNTQGTFCSNYQKSWCWLPVITLWRKTI